METKHDNNTAPCQFEDNPSLKGREDKFIVIPVKVDVVLASWRESLFAHDWLNADGSIKAPKAMSGALHAKRIAIGLQIDGGEVLPRPVLGIGIADNIEIGSGRDIFLTLAARGVKIIPVHIPKGNQAEFRIFSS